MNSAFPRPVWYAWQRAAPPAATRRSLNRTFCMHLGVLGEVISYFLLPHTHCAVHLCSRISPRVLLHHLSLLLSEPKGAFATDVFLAHRVAPNMFPELSHTLSYTCILRRKAASRSPIITLVLPLGLKPKAASLASRLRLGERSTIMTEDVPGEGCNTELLP